MRRGGPEHSTLVKWVCRIPRNFGTTAVKLIMKIRCAQQQSNIDDCHCVTNSQPLAIRLHLLARSCCPIATKKNGSGHLIALE